MQKKTEAMEKEIQEWFLGHGDTLFRFATELHIATVYDGLEKSGDAVFKTLEDAMRRAISDAGRRWRQTNPDTLECDSEGNPLRE
jgi:hypothetical protein